MGNILMSDIRKKFLSYFKGNNHEIVESSNIVPNNDPTLIVHKLRYGSIQKCVYWN